MYTSYTHYTLYTLCSYCHVLLGIDEEDQLLKIFQLVGSPTEESWPGITRLPRYSNIAGFPPKPIANVVPALNTAVS